MAVQCMYYNIVVIFLIWQPMCHSLCVNKPHGLELNLECDQGRTIFMTKVIHYGHTFSFRCNKTIQKSDWRQELVNCNWKSMCNLNAKPTCRSCLICIHYEEVCYDCLLSTRQCVGQNMTLECDENYSIKISSVLHGKAFPCYGDVLHYYVNEKRLNYISDFCNGLEECSFQSSLTRRWLFLWMHYNYEWVFYECTYDPKLSTTQFGTTLKTTIQSTSSQLTKSSSESVTTEQSTSSLQTFSRDIFFSTRSTRMSITDSSHNKEGTFEDHHQTPVAAIVVPSVLGGMFLVMILPLIVFLIKRKRKKNSRPKEMEDMQSNSDTIYGNAAFIKDLSAKTGLKERSNKSAMYSSTTPRNIQQDEEDFENVYYKIQTGVAVKQEEYYTHIIKQDDNTIYYNDANAAHNGEIAQPEDRQDDSAIYYND
ncbi:unnamed protein product, partial [Owenia fusiformis]